MNCIFAEIEQAQTCEMTLGTLVYFSNILVLQNANDHQDTHCLHLYDHRSRVALVNLVSVYGVIDKFKETFGITTFAASETL